jgi:nitroreductase
MIENLILKNRSYRRFHQNGSLSTESLKDLVNLGRLSASAGNLQPLKYLVSNTPERNEKIFPCLGWAGYLKDWPGPAEHERPSAYIVILGDSQITTNFGCDHGIAAQSILLGAAEQGLGGCIIGSINKHKLRDVLNIPAHLKILLVLALGKPNEKIVLEEAKDDIKYWRDEKSVHHVPKRKIEDIIVEF